MMNPFGEAAKEAARRQEQILVRLRNDLKNNRLAIITGAGVTLNVTADESGRPLSRIAWTGLIRNGLDYLVSEGYVDTSNRRTKRAYEALEDPEIDGLLDAANIVSSQMKQHGQFPTWLESVFGSLSQEIRHPALIDVLKALYERGATLLTTNYDDVLEKYCGLQRICRSNKDDISRFQRGDLNGVFHIHGSYHDAHEVVLDTTDYYEVKHSDGLQDMLKTFLQYKTILFIGCGSGLEDPNFNTLLKWASERHKNIPHRHCLLIRDGDSLNYQPLVQVKYGPRYEDLVAYLKRLLGEQTGTQSQAVSDNPDSTRGKAVALFTFDAVQPGDLGFKKGDIITITKKTEKSNDWWTGIIGSRTGIFPSNYVQIQTDTRGLAAYVDPESTKSSRPKPDPTKVRTWTDHSGSFSVEAQFRGLKDGKIHLHKRNGVKIAVPVIKMSIKDLEYVEHIIGVSLDEDKLL